MSVEADACYALPTWRLQPGLQFKKANRLMRSAMDLHLLPFLLGARSRNDLQHFIGDLLLSASAAVRLVDGRAFCLFFFFYTVDRTTNQVQTPSLPYENSFVCPRCANF